MSKTSKVLSWGWPCFFGIGLEGALPLFAQGSTASSEKALKVENPNFQREAPVSLRISKCDHGYLRAYGFRLQGGIHSCNQNFLLSKGYPAHYADCRWVGAGAEGYLPWDSNAGEVSKANALFGRASLPWVDRLNYVIFSQVEVGHTPQHASSYSLSSSLKNGYFSCVPMHWRYFFRSAGHFGLGAHGVVAAAPDLKLRPAGAVAQGNLKLEARWLHQLGLHAETSFLNLYRGTVWVRMPCFQASTAVHEEKIQYAFQAPISWAIRFNASACCFNSFFTSPKIKSLTPFLDGFLESKGWLCSQGLAFQSQDDAKSRGKGMGWFKGLKVRLPLALDLVIGWDSSLETEKMHDNQASILGQFCKKFFCGNFSLSLVANYRQDMDFKEQLTPTAQRQMVLKTKLASRLDLVEDLSPHLLFGIHEEFVGIQKGLNKTPLSRQDSNSEQSFEEASPNPELESAFKKAAALAKELSSLGAQSGNIPVWEDIFQGKEEYEDFLLIRLLGTQGGFKENGAQEVKESDEEKEYREESEKLLQSFKDQLSRLVVEKSQAPVDESDEEKRSRQESLNLLKNAQEALNAEDLEPSLKFLKIKPIGADENLSAWFWENFYQENLSELQRFKNEFFEELGKEASEEEKISKEKKGALKTNFAKSSSWAEEVLKMLQKGAASELQEQDCKDFDQRFAVSSEDWQELKENLKLKFETRKKRENKLEETQAGPDKRQPLSAKYHREAKELINFMQGCQELLSGKVSLDKLKSSCEIASNGKRLLQSLQEKASELKEAHGKVQSLEDCKQSPEKFETGLSTLAKVSKTCQPLIDNFDKRLHRFPVKLLVRFFNYHLERCKIEYSEPSQS